MNDIDNEYLGENQIIHIESWNEYQNKVRSEKYRRWAFRGHEKSDWKLESTLSRYLIDFNVKPKHWGELEERIIRIFRRKASLFLSQVPESDDHFQWLSIMQHSGAPTRLLDFTWSPYVAAFFALERAKSESAVWAINFSVLKDKVYGYDNRQRPIYAPRPRDLESYREQFSENKTPFITAGEPYDMNQRQIAQTGTFLIPGIIDKPIECILSEWSNPENVVVKFVLNTKKIRDDAMEHLYYMNITNASLFPGLDGLARSLAYELEFHWEFNAKSDEGDEN